MDHTHVVAGSHETLATNIALTTRADVGDSTIALYAFGMGPATGTGNVEILSNGEISAQAGNAFLQLTTSLAGESSALIDGGPLGSVTLASAMPLGNAQTLKMDGVKQSIEISNGNVPGVSQVIELNGLTQSIQLNSGGTPASPNIQISPLGIKLSAGPTNFIEIGLDGINISGLAVAIKGLLQAELEAAKISIQAATAAAIKAGIVTIQ